jgi:hypothetical protein
LPNVDPQLAEGEVGIAPTEVTMHLGRVGQPPVTLYCHPDVSLAAVARVARAEGDPAYLANLPRAELTAFAQQYGDKGLLSRAALERLALALAS